MSRIVTTRFLPGQVAEASDANARFSAFQTGTGDLDENNFRDQAVDRRNLATSILIRSESTTHDPGSSTTFEDGYTEEASSGVGWHDLPNSLIDMSGDPAVVKQGDLVRIYWNLLHYDWDSTPTVANEYCWLVWPRWDVTNNTLGNFEDVPGNDTSAADFWNLGSSPGIEVADAKHLGVIPVRSGIDPSGTPAYVEHERNNVMGSFFWVNDGADKNVYGIKLYLAGPFHFFHYDSGAGYAEEVFQPVVSNKADINVRSMQLAFMQLRR